MGFRRCDIFSDLAFLGNVPSIFKFPRIFLFLIIFPHLDNFYYISRLCKIWRVVVEGFKHAHGNDNNKHYIYSLWLWNQGILTTVVLTP